MSGDNQELIAKELMNEVLAATGKKDDDYVDKLFEEFNKLRYKKLYYAAGEILRELLKVTYENEDYRVYCFCIDIAGDYYMELEQYKEAEEAFKKAIEVSEVILNDDELTSAFYYSNLAELYKIQGRYKESEELYKRILKIKEKNFRKKNPDPVITDKELEELGELKDLEDLEELFQIQVGYEESEELDKIAFEIEENESVNEHPDIITAYNNLAELYEEQERYKELEKLYKRALRIFEKKLGKEHINTAMMYKNLAQLYISQGRYEESREILCRILLILLEINKRELGEEHQDTLTIYNDLAELYEVQGRYKELEEIYKKVLEIRERKLGKKDIDTLSAYNDLAVLYYIQGKYEESGAIYKNILEIAKIELGKEHSITLTTYNNLAVLYTAQGKYEESEELHKRVLEIRKREFGEGHLDTAQSYDSLASLYQVQGKYEESEELHKRALEIRKSELGEEHPKTLTTYNNLAGLYGSQGRYEESEELYKKVLEISERILGKEHRDTLITYNNLADIYHIQGRLKESEELYKRVLEIRERVLGKEHPDTALIYNNLAGVYESQRRYAESEELFKKVLEIRERVLGKEHPETAEAYHNLAGIYHSQERYKESEELYKRALKILERKLGKEHPNTATTYNNLAILYEKQGRYEEALKQQYKGLLAIGKTIQRANYMASKKSAKAIKIKNLINYEAYLCILRNIKNPHFSYLMLLFTMKQGEIYSSNLKNVLFKQHANDEQKAQWTRLIDDLKRVEGELVAFQSSEIFGEEILKIKIEEKNILEDKLWALEREVLPSLNALRNFERAEPETLLELLPSNEVVIEFFKYRDVYDSFNAEYCVLIVDSKNVDEVKLVNLGDADTIDFLIFLLRSQIILNSIDNIHLIEDIKKDLYNVLIKPIEKYLEKWDKVCVCPDGELTRLPFEVLIGNKDIRYMGSICDVVWLNIQGRVIENKGVVAANADYDACIKSFGGKTHAAEITKDDTGKAIERSGVHFKELYPFEGLYVSDILKQKCSEVELLQKETFIKSNFLKIKSPKILHITTHGFFCENTDYKFNLVSKTKDNFESKISKLEDPMDRAGLALTGANTALKGEIINEGIVTAREISKMDLLGTELAVLSACETGLGDVKVGDGVYGLQRAFFISGVKTLVMSLWKVDDIAATLLMKKFYEHLVKGKRVDVSLKLAKEYLKEMTIEEVACNYLNLAKRYLPDITDEDCDGFREWLYGKYSDKPFSHPFYWAGFICMGAGGRIQFT